MYNPATVEKVSNATSMRYYTQLVFVKPGQEERFHEFEDHVLPLLDLYGGRLLLRWRRTEGCVIGSDAGEDPYEVHLVTFPTRTDFEAYSNDDARRSYLYLKDASVERVILVEGARI